MCFRLVYTLEHLGYLLKVEQRYELLTEPPRHRHYRIGYAAPGDADFFREVLDGLERASAQHRIALTVVNNRFKPAVALKSARARPEEGCSSRSSVSSMLRLRPSCQRSIERRGSR